MKVVFVEATVPPFWKGGHPNLPKNANEHNMDVCSFANIFDVWSCEFWSHHSREFGCGSLVFWLLVFVIDQCIFIYVNPKPIPQHEILWFIAIKNSNFHNNHNKYGIMLILGHNTVVFGHAIVIFNF